MTDTPSTDDQATTPEEHPEFAIRSLAVGLEEALERAHTGVSGLHESPTDQGVKLRTTDGKLVAILREPTGAAEEAKARLQYRTAPASEAMTRKAAKIKTALEPVVVDSESSHTAN